MQSNPRKLMYTCRLHHFTFLVSGILALVFIMFFATACHKDVDKPGLYDTIFPHSYFPAWPGSWWVYQTGDTLKVLVFETFSYNKAAFDAVPDYDTIVIPRLYVKNVFNLPDSFAWLKDNELTKPSNSSYRDRVFKTLFSLQKGIFYIGAPWQGHAIIGETVAVDTSIAIQQQEFHRVVVCIFYDDMVAQLLGKSQAIFRREFWAENVGLVRRDEKPIPSTPQDFQTTLELRGFMTNKD